MDKEYRLKKLFNKSGKILLIPLDHGFTQGPVEGLKDIRKDLREIVMAGPDAIIVHKGLMRYLDLELCVEKNVSIIIHLMGSTDMSLSPNDKRVVCTVEEAIRLGADAVSVHVNIGAETENDMIERAAEISRDCEYWNMPLLGMFYPRGPEITDATDSRFVAHVSRIAVELNMDMVKTNYTSKETFAEVVQETEIPLIIAGGSNITDEEILYKTYDAIQAGGKGAAIGRNVFQNPNRVQMIKALSEIIHNNKSVEDALRLIYDEEMERHG